MFELFNLQFFLGLIFGGLVVFGIYPYIFKKKEQDLSTFESNLQNIDKAFICMNLPYTMTEASAAEAVLEFEPREVYPYHYRGRPNVSDVIQFKELVNKGNPAIKVTQLDWYPNDDF